MTTEEFGKKMADKVTGWAAPSVAQDIFEICGVKLDTKQTARLIKKLSATFVVIIAEILDMLAEVDGLYALDESKLSEVLNGD